MTGRGTLDWDVAFVSMSKADGSAVDPNARYKVVELRVSLVAFWGPEDLNSDYHIDVEQRAHRFVYGFMQVEPITQAPNVGIIDEASVSVEGDVRDDLRIDDALVTEAEWFVTSAGCTANPYAA